MMVPLMFFKI